MFHLKLIIIYLIMHSTYFINGYIKNIQKSLISCGSMIDMDLILPVYKMADNARCGLQMYLCFTTYVVIKK